MNSIYTDCGADEGKGNLPIARCLPQFTLFLLANAALAYKVPVRPFILLTHYIYNIYMKSGARQPFPQVLASVLASTCNRPCKYLR